MPLNEFIARSKVNEVEIERLKNETAIFRIYGRGNEREIELAHDQIAKRALISKKEREANLIKIYTLSIAATFLVFLGLIMISAYSFIREQEKLFTVQHLMHQVNVLETENKQMQTEFQKTTLYSEKIRSYLSALNQEYLLKIKTLSNEALSINDKNKSHSDSLVNQLSYFRIQYMLAVDSMRLLNRSFNAQSTELTNWKNSAQGLQANYNQLKTKFDDDEKTIYQLRLNLQQKQQQPQQPQQQQQQQPVKH
jgi:hypothetical protein